MIIGLVIGVVCLAVTDIMLTVADSACSVTAYLGGVKGTYRTIGLTGAGRYKDCNTQLDTENHVSSIMAWAQAAGKATGVVSTNGITDASPAGAYAHVAYRGWYNDWEVIEDGADPEICDDIAEQVKFSVLLQSISHLLSW